MSTHPRNLSEMLPRMPQLEAIGAEYGIDFYSDAARAAFDGLRVDAERAGYRVVGRSEGPYYWVRVDGDESVDTSASTWRTQHEAWGDAIIAHCADLMEL